MRGRGTGFLSRINLSSIDPLPVQKAWKTGTSSGHRDAWCAAVTPRRTVVVWLGNASGQGAAALVGQEAAAPLALRLLAAIDPGGESWPVVPEPSAAPSLLAALEPAAAVTILSPREGQQLVLSPDLPAERQKVLLEARARSLRSGRPSSLWWFMDGQMLGSATAGQGLWWSPSPGAHEMRVVDADGHHATARVYVR